MVCLRIISINTMHKGDDDDDDDITSLFRPNKCLYALSLLHYYTHHNYKPFAVTNKTNSFQTKEEIIKSDQYSNSETNPKTWLMKDKKSRNVKRTASADGCTHIMTLLYLFRPVRSTGENNAHERENSLDRVLQFFPPSSPSTDADFVFSTQINRSSG